VGGGTGDPPPEGPAPAEPPAPPALPTEVDAPIQDIKDTFGDFIPQDRLDGLSADRVRVLSSQEFDQAYRAARGRGADPRGVMGFYDATTGQIRIRAGKARLGLTALHEQMHAASNGGEFNWLVFDSHDNIVPRVGQKLKEAFTDHFTNQIARNHALDNSDTLYNADGRVAVAEDIESLVGENVVRQAYFGDGAEPVEDMIRAVDERCGEGTWGRVRQLCENGDFAGARAVLRPHLGAGAAPAAP